MATGSIRERSGPTGKAWQVRVYNGIDPATGAGRWLTKTVRGTRRDAERVRLQLLTEVAEGAHAGPDGPLADLLDRWVATKAAKWSPKTTLETRGAIERWIAPDPTIHPERARRAPGATAVRAITAAQLDDWYAWLLTQLEPSTVKRIGGMVHAALAQAVRWDWILRNPASRTEPIEGRPAEIVPPTTDQVAALLAHLMTPPEGSTAPHPIATFVRLSATTGRRRGELCALRWTDIDLDAATLLPRRTLVDSDRGWIERPISKNPTRMPPLSLDEGTVEILRAHHKAMAAELARLGITLAPDAHVFVRVGPGRTPLPWSPDGVSRRFARAREAVGLEGVRLHDLRHYVATTLLDKGVPLTTVAGRLGHGGGGRTTQAVYAHWVKATDRDATAMLADLIDAQPEESASQDESDETPSPS
jgi:integrase